MQTINVNIDNPISNNTLYVVQGDVGSRSFKVALYENGSAFSVKGKYASIQFQHAKENIEGWYSSITVGDTTRDACSISDNVITCELAPEVLQCEGEVFINVCVSDTANAVAAEYILHSFPIHVHVEKAAVTDGEAIESEYFQGAFGEAADELKEVIAETANATTSAAGLMSAADKKKLDGIASGANEYTLPTASSTVLGGIKVGDGLKISSGVLSTIETDIPYYRYSDHYDTSTAENGYFHLLTLTVTGTYVNQPMLLHIVQRGSRYGDCVICFTNANSTDTEVAFLLQSGNLEPIYIAKTDTSTWNLYIQKTEKYDHAGILEAYAHKYFTNRVTVTAGSSHTDTLPDGYVQATQMPWYGNAATATKATSDGSGNNIASTYIKSLSVSGKTITYTKGDDTTGTLTTQDTTYTLPSATKSVLGGVKTTTGATTLSEVSGKVPMSTSAGTMEIGRYLDFHYDDTAADYSGRIDVSGNNANTVHLPSKSGTLALEDGVTALQNNYTSRPTSANVIFGDGTLRHFEATTSMTTGKPPADSHIIHSSWDTTSGWEYQLALRHGGQPNLFIRSQDNGTWGNWLELSKITSYTLTIPSSATLTYKTGTYGAWYYTSGLSVTTDVFHLDIEDIDLTISNKTSTTLESSFADWTWHLHLTAVQSGQKVFTGEIVTSYSTSQVTKSCIELHAYSITSTSASINLVCWHEYVK